MPRNVCKTPTHFSSYNSIDIILDNIYWTDYLLANSTVSDVYSGGPYYVEQNRTFCILPDRTHSITVPIASMGQ